MVLTVIIPILSLIVSSIFMGDSLGIYFLLAGQLSMLLGVASERHLTGGCAFLFMSFLFFGVRPLYILIENDQHLIVSLFRFVPTMGDMTLSMWWGTAGMLAFVAGRIIASKGHLQRWRERSRQAKIKTRSFKIAGTPIVVALIFYQIGSLGVLLFLGSAGKGLYGSALGAYIYDLPSILQAGHIFSLLLTLERFLRERSFSAGIFLLITSILFLAFTLEMRNISNFRGFYITGVMAGGLAVLARLKPNVRAPWLILPVVLLLPAFRLLGETRSAGNENFSEAVSAATEKQQSFVRSYWDFYNSDGDINIFDTFLAAQRFEPKTHPYILSWLYVPLHFVPRALWKSKPMNGTLQDMDFTNGAPYSPGIAGFFLLDGGHIWMLLCMTTLGYLIAFMDLSVLTMPRSYLRFCLYGILVVNAMGLSRFFLWQYFYGTLYAVVPCLILAKLVEYNSSKPDQKKRDPRRNRRREPMPSRNPEQEPGRLPEPR